MPSLMDSFNETIHDKIIIDGVEKGFKLKPSGNTISIRQITKGSMRSRFTLAEKVAIKTSADPAVQVLEEDMNNSSYIDLDDNELLTGLTYLEQTASVLAVGRVAELLADGTESEKWQG